MRAPAIPAALALALLVLGGAACTPADQDRLARDAARAAITPVLLDRFPGVPLEPALDCVIDNATGRELLALAADSVTGATASTVEIVTGIASRPATVRCFVQKGLAGQFAVPGLATLATRG